MTERYFTVVVWKGVDPIKYEYTDDQARDDGLEDLKEQFKEESTYLYIDVRNNNLIVESV